MGGRGVRIAVAAGLFLAGHVDPDNLNPSLQPLQWPTLQALPHGDPHGKRSRGSRHRRTHFSAIQRASAWPGSRHRRLRTPVEVGS
jgi:hypothetical protein